SLSNINLITSNNKYILKNINIDINKGDCVSISGHNGAGKTTLFKLVNGLIKPTSGTVKIFNNQLNNEIKKQIGYIPQINKFEENIPITVKQVIEIGITARKGIFKSLSNQDKVFVTDIAKKLDIYDLLDVPIGKISGGEMQKVSIARVLAQQADIILLDEPLSNLDIKSQKNIIEIIEKIHSDKEHTILIILHNLEQKPKCCNKEIVLEKGEVCSNF
ncbi:MAG: metal ABC transporter ATP-binding protein, partial [Endomicrobiaceae bacterium]|nr:metal ABC transporter ATP-binding protein [Endomicrobiaceae bacterium]